MNNNRKTNKKCAQLRVAGIAEKLFLDLLAVLTAFIITVFTLPGSVPALYSNVFYGWLLCHLVIAFVSFMAGRVYSIAYRAFSFLDAARIAVSLCIVLVLETMVDMTSESVHFSAVLLYVLLLGVLMMGIRSVMRARALLSNRSWHRHHGEKVIIVGAGEAGTAIIRELQATDKTDMDPVAALDDDPAKFGMTVCGVPVVGTTYDVAETVAKYGATRILVAMPSVPAKVMKDILFRCQVPKVVVQTLPGIYQLASGSVSVSKVRNVDVQDLLGREQIHVDLEEIVSYLKGRTVLVTGGGGSIGSELCRQIATSEPKLLIIFDIYENNAYDIEQELRRHHPELNLLTLIGSVRDEGKLKDLFEKYRPEIVFNAAAHKHVPLMETSPNEAVKNNVFGTLNVARCADAYGALRFVQISTDKAVNPTNIMGATKRICEMIVQTIGRHSETEFVAVRFGNVLGSNGSVIPLFKKQIEEGGPVTITHKDIVRYFMTIPEAVSLVLQAGAYAKGGEIYVLDMGEPVKIYDLARNLIRLSGYEPEVDIPIECMGLRPGEKLYEERLMDEEGMQKTANESISIGKPLDIDEENLFAKLDELKKAAYAETDEMKDLVHELVPTYTIDRRN